MASRRERGYSLLELIAVLGIVAVLAGVALAWGGTALARHRAEGAARRIALWFGRARAEATLRGHAVAVGFDEGHGHVQLQLFADGGDDGVRRADIDAGLDLAAGQPWCLVDDYPGVTYGIGERLPDIEGSGWLEPGSEPIRIGSARLLTFTPHGTASGGTVYLTGKDGAAYAIRVLGATARTRVLRFDRRTSLWVSR